MKKFVLLTAAFAFTIGAMAQSTTEKKQAAKSEAQKTKPAAVKVAPAREDVGQPTVVSEATQPAANQPSPDDVMKLNTAKHDFGKIKQGVPVNYSFEIKNTSNKPIVVENSYASCGCTTPEKIVEPIAPGATAKLKVIYNAANPGAFTKDVHIKLAGIAQEKIVQITGEVVPAEPAKPSN
jgi:hypothetical protein